MGTKQSVTMDDFSVLKVIGKGAFGEVKLCEKNDTKEILAVKIMLKKNLREAYIPRLLAECDLMAFSKSKYIITLHYAFQDEKRLYLAMDFMQGGDLMGLLLEKDIFSVEATRFYIGELCLAVHSVHLLGYCHRDLKPDNILLTRDGHVKLCDFGLAKKLATYTKNTSVDPAAAESPAESKETEASNDNDKRNEWKKRKKLLAHSMVGTPDYMAPEIFTSKGYDEICDWWGVGCIMFECLAGFAPFYNGNNDIQETVESVKDWKRKLNLQAVYQTDKNAGDIVSKLICHFSNRLNYHGIKNHDFFKGFNWENCSENKAPYHTEVLTDSLDTRYFNYDEDDEDDEDDEGDGETNPIKNVENFTFYIQQKQKPHHLTDLWTQ